MKLLIAKIEPKRGLDGEIIVSKFGQTLFNVEDAEGKKYTTWGAWLVEGQEAEVELETNKYGTTIKKPKTDLPLEQKTVSTPTTAPSSIESKPDWDKIAEGKVRNSVAVAFISNAAEFNPTIVAEMNLWVRWIMTGLLDES